jgi:hypothetical protein
MIFKDAPLCKISGLNMKWHSSHLRTLHGHPAVINSGRKLEVKDWDGLPWLDDHTKFYGNLSLASKSMWWSN